MARNVKVLNSAQKLQLDCKNAKRFQPIETAIAIFIYLVVSALCIFQLYVVLQRFFDKPIGTCVKVGNAGTFKIPPFIICPIIPGFTDTDEEDNSQDYEDEEMTSDQTEINYKQQSANVTNDTILNLTNLRETFKNTSLNQKESSDLAKKIKKVISAIWMNLTISKARFSSKNCKFAVSREQCLSNINTSLVQKLSDRPTLMTGKCLEISQVELLYYNQRWKEVKFLFKDERDKNKSLAFAFTENMNSIHYLPFEAKLLKFNSLITIDSRKKYYYLNTKMNPCMTVAELRKCIDNSIEKNLMSLDICKLPFLHTTRFIRECGSTDEIINSLNTVSKFFIENNLEMCGRSCEVDSIIFSSNTGQDGNTSNIVFEVTNNVMEEIKEEYSYTLSAMMSDVAGNLGFYLGISLFSILNRPLILLKNRLF